MRAGFNDVSLVHDDDLIGILNGREPVRDDETGAVPHQFDHGVLNMLFGSCIDRGCRLVENKNLRITEESASDRQQLALPLRKVGAGGTVSYPSVRALTTLSQ